MTPEPQASDLGAEFAFRTFFMRAARAVLLTLSIPMCGSCLPWWPAPSMTRGDYTLLFNDTLLTPAPIIANGAPVFSCSSIFQSIPGKTGSHAAAITALPDGELLAAWYSYEGPRELDGATIYVSRRIAGSSRWTAPAPLIDASENVGNPVLYSEDDRVWLFHSAAPQGWATSRIHWQVSEDRGHTWSPSSVIPSPVGWNVRYPPVRTASGLLLLPAYTELVPRSVFYQSHDGQAWSLMGEVRTSPDNIQPSVARLPDDRLVAVMRNCAGGWLWAMGSNDAGRHWSQPMDSGFANPDSSACITALAGGNLLLVFNDSPSQRTPLTAALSADGGQTWPIRKVIVQGNKSYSYPSVAQTSDGLIHLVFSLGRDRIEHVEFNESWLVGREGQPSDQSRAPS